MSNIIENIISDEEINPSGVLLRAEVIVKQRRKKLKKGEKDVPAPDGQKRCVKCNRCYELIHFLRKKDINKKDEDKKYSNICSECREQINECSKMYYKDPERERTPIIKKFCEICEIYVNNLDKHSTCENHNLIVRKMNEALEKGLKK